MRKNRIFYIVCLCFIGFLAWLLKDRYTLTILFTFLLLPIVSLIFTLLSYKKIKCKQATIPESIKKGDNLSFNIKIENESIFFCPFASIKLSEQQGITYKHKPRGAFSINPKNSVLADFDVIFNYRGYYTVGIDKLEIFDFLRIFKFKRKINDKQTICVYPQIHELLMPSSIMNQEQKESNKFYIIENDNSDVFDLRNYNEHDNMKKIHWKLSSKSDELIVKKYASYERTQSLIALDLQPIKTMDDIDIYNDLYEIQDNMIETALSVINYYVKHNKQTDFVYADNKIHLEKINSLNEFNRLCHLSARFTFDASIPIDNIIYNYTQNNTQKITMFILVSSVNQALVERIRITAWAGYKIVLIDFSNENENTQNIKNKFINLQVEYLHPQDILYKN